MQPIHLAWVDYTILIAYVAFVVGIGWMLARYMKTSSDFLTSGRSIPAWVTGLAFISANLGALELVGMAASGAKYGMATSHFYWIGAIPAMVFLAVFMMPFYYGSRARSVPEFLKLRFDERVRFLNAISFAVMTVFASGISMNCLAKLLHLLLGWNYNWSLWFCSAVVLVYVLKGGLTSAIYTEVLQFFMIVLGFMPVVWLGLKDLGGWDAMKSKLAEVAQNPAALNLKPEGVSYSPDAWTSAWKPLLAGSQHNPMGVDWMAMVFGLGFVLAFGYWCTNFLVVQRAMAARNMTSARRTPLIAAIPKMFFPALVILPGMIAAALAFTGKDGYRLPPVAISESAYPPAIAAIQSASPQNFDAAFNAVRQAVGQKMSKTKVAAIVEENAVKPLAEGDLKSRLQDAVAENDYDNVILSLVKKYCPSGLLGLALTGLLASFMSGMAGNVTAFNTVLTYDLYQSYRRHILDRPRPSTITHLDGRQEDVVVAPKDPTDSHYFWMGKVVTFLGILLSIACAYFAHRYSNAMDVIQLVFSFVNAPLFATFLLAMFWARTTGTGAFYGLLGGIMTSGLVHGSTMAEGKGGWLGLRWYEFPSTMAQNFWLASFAFISCFILTFVISVATKRTKSDAELKGLVYSLTPKIQSDDQRFLLRPAVLGTILLICCLILNIMFW
jgi:SSS family solute:Na+ symporter